MANMILNLDEVQETQPVITLGGKSYEMREMTFGDFIAAQKKIKQAEKDGETSEEAQFGGLIDFISNAFPELTTDILNGLSMQKVMLISNFIVEISQENASEADKKKSRKGKRKSS